jgi:hypothetical protein
MKLGDIVGPLFLTIMIASYSAISLRSAICWTTHCDTQWVAELHTDIQWFAEQHIVILSDLLNTLWYSVQIAPL